MFRLEAIPLPAGHDQIGKTDLDTARGLFDVDVFTGVVGFETEDTRHATLERRPDVVTE